MSKTISKPMPVTLVGATGLTGSATLDALLHDTRPFEITTITRRTIRKAPGGQHQGTTFTPKVVENLFEAPKSQVARPGGVYISCLGTTRAAAGGFDKQVKVDLDLNRDLAKKAKEDGATTMILVSSHGATSSSRFGYLKMKGQLDDAVRDMGFEHCIVLRPGFLMGPRENMPITIAFGHKMFAVIGALGAPLHNLCIQGTQVGKCIAHLASNPPSAKFVIIENNEMIRLAAEWDAAQTSKTR